MANKYVIDRDLGLKAYIKDLAEADRAYVTIGVHQGERNADGADIAEYAAANEYGTQDIPSRPAMRATFDESIEWIKRHMYSLQSKVQEGKTTTIIGLSMLGMKYQNRIQTTIQTRNFLPKLKDATAKAKKGSYKTLIDSSAYVNSIRYVVHK
jgi:hypothetical protein